MKAVQRLSVILVAVLQLLPLGTALSQSNKEKYDLDERCGRRAAEYFSKHFGTPFDKTGKTLSFFSFRNHYNSRLNKCIIYLATRAQFEGERDELHTLELLDLNENNRLGMYIGTSTNSRPAASCEVDEKECETEAEWLDLIKKYMED
jgi:hypothetical protein